MRTKLVIFDIAGTTVEDPDGVGGCLKAALDSAGVPWEADAVNAIMGIPKPVAIKTLIEAVGQQANEERIQEIHRDFQGKIIEYYRTSALVKPIEGATEVFADLKSRGIKVALDTGFDRPIVDVLLDRLGWNSETIDGSTTSDEVAQGRPHPDLVFHLMEKFGITDPKEVAKVGDTPSDLGEGTAAGCGFVIGVTYGTHTREQLQLHLHTHLVDSIREIPDLVS